MFTSIKKKLKFASSLCHYPVLPSIRNGVLFVQLFSTAILFNKTKTHFIYFHDLSANTRVISVYRYVELLHTLLINKLRY